MLGESVLSLDQVEPVIVEAWLPHADGVLFVAVYAAASLANFFINRREFIRSPAKGIRYRKLPVQYKLGCWFVVLPLFAGTVLVGWLFVPGIIAYALLEVACVRWYRAAGLL